MKPKASRGETVSNQPLVPHASTNGTYGVAITCPHCKQVHVVPLNAGWTFEGELPCGVMAELELEPNGTIH